MRDLLGQWLEKMKINYQTRICFLRETDTPPPAIGMMQFCTESQVLVQQRGINSESK